MRAAYTLQRGGIRHATPEVRPVSTRDVLRTATLGGARAAHVDHLVGSLTPGTRADVVVQLMDTSNVETVLVDGHPVKRDGRLVGVDVGAVLDALSRSAAGLLHRSGAPSVLLTSCRRG